MMGTFLLGTLFGLILAVFLQNKYSSKETTAQIMFNLQVDDKRSFTLTGLKDKFGNPTEVPADATVTWEVQAIVGNPATLSISPDDPKTGDLIANNEIGAQGQLVNKVTLADGREIITTSEMFTCVAGEPESGNIEFGEPTDT